MGGFANSWKFNSRGEKESWSVLSCKHPLKAINFWIKYLFLDNNIKYEQNEAKKKKRSTIKNSNDSQNTLSSSTSSRNTFNEITSRSI